MKAVPGALSLRAPSRTRAGRRRDTANRERITAWTLAEMTEIHEMEQARRIVVFERSESQVRRGGWMLLGGVVMACVAVLGFLLALFSRADQLSVHAMSTLPMIIALGLLAGGWTLSSGPRSVTIDDAGLQIERGRGTERHQWSEIGWVTVTATTARQRRLVLYDVSGKKMAALGEVFDSFDDLISIVKSKVADQPTSVGPGIQLRKARKSAVLMASFASLMILAAASLAWMTYGEQRAARLLETDAVEGVATVDRLFVAPNGSTTRIEYTVTNEAGESGSRNAEIELEVHAELMAADAESVPVMFVPAEPAISRLQRGEIVDDDFMDSPAGGYGLSALVTLMCLFFLGAAALQWRGWDIDLDSKTGKISIKRFGEGE